MGTITREAYRELLDRQSTPSKYHNKKTIIGDITFASKKEARRYLILKQMAVKGQIKNLILQPVFEIVINEQKVCRYVADFQYDWGGRQIVEDAKGMKTDIYRLKKKLMQIVLNIEVVET